MSGGSFFVESEQGKETFSLSFTPAKKAREIKNDKGEIVCVYYYDGPFKNAEFTISGKVPVFSLQSDGKHTLSVRQYPERLSITQHNREKSSLSFFMDMSAGEKTASSKEGMNSFAGVNFAGDNLSVPDYGKSKNLLQNPSFEAGFRYWRDRRARRQTVAGFAGFRRLFDRRDRGNTKLALPENKRLHQTGRAAVKRAVRNQLFLHACEKESKNTPSAVL